MTRTRTSPATPWRRRIRRTLLGLLAFFALLWLLDRAFPPPLPDPAGSAARVVLDRQGRPLRAFADDQGEWRQPITLAQVAPDYLEALIRYEDHRYHDHFGIDPIALLRATAQAVRHGRIVSGGSTLTMQVARLLEELPHDLSGKLRQMLRALQLEWRLDKRQILELYLAYAPYGGPIQGLEAASRSYLGKPASDLTRAEAALMVVLPQAPSRLRPDRHPGRAQAARDKVLQRMARLGVWSIESVESARLEQVHARRLQPPMTAPLLAQRLASASAESVIHSQIDLDWQRTIEERVTQYLDRLPARTSAGVMVMEAVSGAVRVYVGSARFGDPQRLGHVDMLTAVRSPGSTLKPFLYGLALDQHLIHSESLLVDAPRQLRGYRPGNFGGSFEGPVAASEALRRSLNVPAVDLLERIGPRAFAASLEHAGLPLALPAGAEPNLSLILGGSGARLEDLLGAWRAIAGSGLAIRPRLRLDDPIEERRLLSPGAAWIVRRMLSSDPFSGGSERLFVPDGASTLAWKTGTSYGFRDAWALGLRGELVIGVWIGRPDGTPMPGEYGALTALPLLVQVGQSLPGHSVLPAKPANVTALEICWPLGQAPDPSAPELCHQRRTAWTLDGIVPTTLPDLDEQRWQAAVVRYRIDPASGLRRHANCSRPDLQTRQLARWPLRATPWLAAELRRLSQPPPLAADCPPDQLAPPLLIVRGIESDSTLRSSAGPGEPINLELSVLGNSSTTWWLLNQQLIGTSEAALPLRLRLEQVGDYELVALAADGRHRRVAFRMR